MRRRAVLSAVLSGPVVQRSQPQTGEHLLKMGWACAPTVIYNAFRLQKRAKKSHKDYTGQPSAESLSRSFSTDDSGSENNSSVFTQDEDMQ